jgi:pimeloyl-ACP methyl ester carboxylesterase
MPRGPLTTTHVVASLLAGLLTGGVAGYASNSRWSVVAAPVAFAAVFELARTGTVGPTTEGFHASFYGLLATITGRGVHGLVSLAPMALAAVAGGAVARRGLGVSKRRHTGRRVGVIVLAAIVAVPSLLLIRPASTAAIVDSTGRPISGSVAELTTVNINSHDLAMMIRSVDTSNPVLLFLAGGPGGSELGAMRRHLSGLEEHFVVVTWDQRGSGRSYAALDPTSTLTLESVVDDTIAVTNYLRERFGQDRIYVAGQSWGTTLGVLAVQQRPDLYQAFIGTGQMVSQRETDLIFYEDTLAWAEQTGRIDLFTELVNAGPPPYEEIYPYETLLAQEPDVYPYDHTGNSEGAGQMAENILVPEYSLLDQVHIFAGFVDTFSVLYPQLQEIDFRETATDFDVPVFFVQGAHEARGRAQPFAEWYAMIDAPMKDTVTFETSGHRPLWEQPEEFVDYMTGTVLAETRS